MRMLRRDKARGLTMNLQDSIADTVGNTPLLKLNKVIGHTRATVAVKLDFFNPGGSLHS